MFDDLHIACQYQTFTVIVNICLIADLHDHVYIMHEVILTMGGPHLAIYFPISLHLENEPYN